MIISFDNPIVKGADTKSNLRNKRSCAQVRAVVTLKVIASRTLLILENPAMTYFILHRLIETFWKNLYQVVK